jgi:asparagine synthase (glutamine-hydrolysing)
MCGIVGIFNQNRNQNDTESILHSMVACLAHRGPDDMGFYHSDRISMGQSRLSIIDIEGGNQPVYNEDRLVVVIYNGEIFNYLELRGDLIKRGHVFYTKSDTEVIVHLYEEYGTELFNHLNGQFAIALWDKKRKQLILARDRVGICPLFFTVLDDQSVVFGSEVKAIFRYPGISRSIDPESLRQIFSYWVTVPSRTIFKNISQVPSAHFLVIDSNGRKMEKYWRHQFPRTGEYERHEIGYYTKNIRELLYDASYIRLRADVPVGAYISGGIDSSIITGLVHKIQNNTFNTFSLGFADPDYDESSYQQIMQHHIQVDGKHITVTQDDLNSVLNDIIRYAETPILRSAPGPLYLLSKLVNTNGFKVVLTGEGADEYFGGYNIFKEDKIRRFWANDPESKYRPLLLSRLYPYIRKDNKNVDRFWIQFFGKKLLEIDNPFYSHALRWDNTQKIMQFLSPDYFLPGTKEDHSELLAYVDPDFMEWHPFARAQYLEIQLFMSGYLLSSQGDRMLMANSVEGRYPFLDHRVIEFASAIPPILKMYGLNEKYILRKSFEGIVPKSLLWRKKQPYRAPAPLLSGALNTNGLIRDVMAPETIAKNGYFDAGKVQRLLKKYERLNGANPSARDEMAMNAILSTQLLHYNFIENMI